MAITGDRRFMTIGPGSLQTLLAQIAFGQGAVQLIGGRRDSDPATQAIEQQWRTGFEQEDRRTSTNHRRDTQRPRNDGAVGGGATVGGDDPCDPGRVQAGHVGRADLGHDQYVGLLGFCGLLHAAQLRQHPSANVAQIGRALGEQGIVQGLLLPCSGLDHRHPGCCRAFALGQPLIDVIAQGGVSEHFLMGDEDLADGLVASLHQGVQIRVDRLQRLAQFAAFLRRRLTA